MEKIRYADRGGDNNSHPIPTEWDHVLTISSQVSDSLARSMLIQLSRVRLIPTPQSENTPQAVEEKIRARAEELQRSGQTQVANTIISALAAI